MCNISKSLEIWDVHNFLKQKMLKNGIWNKPIHMQKYYHTLLKDNFNIQSIIARKYKNSTLAKVKHLRV